MERRRRLADRLTSAAGELLAHVLDHLPLPRHELQRLGHILADLAQPVPATAWTIGRRGMNDTLPRQVFGQRPPRRTPPLEWLHVYLRGLGAFGCQLRIGFGLRCILLEVGEL